METIRLDQFPNEVMTHAPQGITFTLGNVDGVLPTGAGYAPGCIYQDIVNGVNYVNLGSNTAANFVAIGGGASTITTPTGSPGSVTTVQGAFNELYQNEITSKGFIPIPLASWRLIGSNDIPVIAVASGNGGNLASDTAPKLIRTNTSTDKSLTITWAASSNIEVTAGIYYPPDMDVTKTYTVNLLAKMNGATDTPVVAVGVFEGVGDTNRGGNSGALSATAAVVSATITPTTGFPNFASISLTPGAHTTNTLILYAAYILYNKKILTT